MKTLFIDPDSFTCHTNQSEDASRIPYETDIFDGKCNSYIEGFRIIPEGCSWTRSDGIVFTGEMIAPRKDYTELDAAQREYERTTLEDAENALAILLGGTT